MRSGFLAVLWANLVVIAAFALGSPPQASAAPVSQEYRIASGQMISVCGGFSGGCNLYPVEGTLSFEIDFDTNVSVLTAFHVRYTVMDGGNSFTRCVPRGCNPGIGISGTLEDSTLSFEEFESHIGQALLWTFSPLGMNPGDVTSWLGFVRDISTDSYTYAFDETTGPAGLVLVPEPGSLVLVGFGLAGLAVRRRRENRSRRA